MTGCVANHLPTMSRQLGMLLFIATCCLADVRCWAEEAVDGADIKAWIAQLDGDLFATREKAQEQLEQAGLSALEAVAEESQEGSLESSTRAINILLYLSESEDRKIRVAALEKLSTLPGRPKEAKIALELLADVRELVALEAIEELGGYYVLLPRSRADYVGRQIVFGSKWKGGNAGLQHLSALQSSTSGVTRDTFLSFYSSSVDDSTLAAIPYNKSVRRLDFFGTRKVSKEAYEKLRQRYPHVKVDVRQSGAQLGILGDTAGSARIRFVNPGSAADKAGLKANDLITELNGEKIPDFTTLTNRISQHEPGESVKLKLVRNRKIEEVTVTFDRWGEKKILLPGSRSSLDDDVESQVTPPIRLERR